MLFGFDLVIGNSVMSEDYAKLFVLDNGDRILGFARDFIRTSIKATLRFPLNHGPISTAVAALLVKAFRNGRQDQVLSFIADLSSDSPSQVNLRAVSLFVHAKYQNMGFDYPLISEFQYANLFQRQLKFAARVIISSSAHVLANFNSPVSDYAKNFGEFGEGEQLDLALALYSQGLSFLSESELEYQFRLFEALYQAAEDDPVLNQYVDNFKLEISVHRDPSIPIENVVSEYTKKIGPRMVVITKAVVDKLPASS